MMTRRTFLCGLTLGTLSASATAEAQQAERIPRIGLLVGGSKGSAYGPLVDSFRQGLRELGYIEGRNVLIEYRWAGGEPERLGDLAAELVRLKVDIIVTHGTPPTRAAQKATKTIPIVMYAGDAVATGLVATLARPGGNTTGSSYLFTELSTKRLEFLTATLPGVTRVAVLVNPANPGHGPALEAMGIAAQSLGIELLAAETRGPAEFDRAFTAMNTSRAAALVVLDDYIAVQYRAQVADLAVRHRLPTMVGSREQAEAGGLVAYGPDFLELWRRHATFVDKILRGAKPTDLPIEQPTKFQLVINLKTAKALGLTIPPSVLLRADQVIE